MTKRFVVRFICCLGTSVVGVLLTVVSAHSDFHDLPDVAANQETSDIDGRRSPRPANVEIRVRVAGRSDGDIAPDEEISVEFGRAFDVEVVSSRRSNLVATAWSPAELAPLELHPVVPSETIEDAGRITERHRYRAYLFQVGEVEVPSVVFRAKPADGGRAHVAFSDPVALIVRSSLAADDDGRPELDGEPTPLSRAAWSWSRLWPVVVGCLVVVVGGFIAWSLLLRRRGPDDCVDALTRAKTRLAALPNPTEVDADPWYVAVSDIVRDYVAERFGIRAPEMTTEEFLGHARTSTAITPRHRDLLADFLARCDRVKFADHRPAESEFDEVLAATRMFVDEASHTDAASEVVA